ncbi:hypothetical protein [Klebsiella quasivariicola]|uniref:hypothetical protein n=1 Tax=Klebsiella quasivariicola TaxID=2026240 RepID=UPI00247ADFC9|nr:hypothetical protein [Klebsiella quasivariicola]
MSNYLFNNYQGIYFEGEFEDENAALRAFRDHRSVPKWDPVQNCQTYMFPENAGVYAPYPIYEDDDIEVIFNDSSYIVSFVCNDQYTNLNSIDVIQLYEQGKIHPVQKIKVTNHK